MKAVSITNRGGRENNEDCVRHTCSGDMWCFVLCDGLGGHEGGEVASGLAAEMICAEFEKAPAVTREAAGAYLESASARLFEERGNNAELFNMSTTAVLLLTDGVKAVWAHIGDSRLYYIESGAISIITDDHSVAFLEFQSGAITYDDIRKSPNQNKLLRCVGNENALEPDVSAVREVKSGDAFLLCSDGFWEYVKESDIEQTLRNANNPKEWIERMLEILHKNETEYNDNYSAIAVMI